MTTLVEFYDRLAEHDWFYHMVDDHQTWMTGKANAAALHKIGEESPEHAALLAAWKAHVYSGAGFGIVRQPRPPRPA